MARNDGGFQIKWETIIMGIGLVVVLVGGFWTLAYIPIDNNQKRLENQVKELRDALQHHMTNDESKYLTQKEHNEFKSTVRDADDRHSTDIAEIKKTITAIRTEAMTRADAQQLLNTTRVEFLAEIKRLDQESKDSMKRREFEVWKSERDKLIASIQERQIRFTEALEKLMQQMPNYTKPQ